MIVVILVDPRRVDEARCLVDRLDDAKRYHKGTGWRPLLEAEWARDAIREARQSFSLRCEALHRLVEGFGNEAATAYCHHLMVG